MSTTADLNTILVVVPTPLRRFTAGKSELETNGSTLREVFEQIDARYPGLSARLLDGDKVRNFLKVFIGDEDCRHSGELNAVVAGGDTITILTSMAGG